MEIVMKILEIFKWPIAVIILGIVLIFRLTPDLRKLLDRIKSFGKDGFKTEEINGQIHRKQVTAKDLMKIFDNRLLLETEGLIKSELEKISHDSMEEKEMLLIKLYASEKIARAFDQTYKFIFGSQIMALQHLNSFAGNLVKNDEIKSFYEEASRKYPTFYNTYSFEEWLRFMDSSIFILRQQNLIGITVRGQEFLKYLIDQGLAHNKAG